MDAHHLTYEYESAAKAEPSRGHAVVRRVIDLLLATMALLLLLPLVVGVAVAIRVDTRGSAIFRQRRLGRHMTAFTVWKFRTMYADSDESRHRDYVRDLIGSKPETTSDEVALYKLEGDDRVTRVGRRLRRWSIDELPQLWNVLRGDMSLIGPRPVIPYEVESYPDWYRQRFSVKPGMTGLWQVSGRNERTYEEMVRLDIDYARKQSLGLDFSILARTIWVIVRRRGVA